MATDYAKISMENVGRYGTEVSVYGSDFAERYTERTHFIYELLQNAEDALRWQTAAEPHGPSSRAVEITLFSDRIECSHFGQAFHEDNVRAICSIKRGTKENSLTDIGKFGIGFKSVFAYSKRPEIHSGDEHFAIESFVHPRGVKVRETKAGQTLFYIPFDADQVTPVQSYSEISGRLPRLGLRTLLFLREIQAINWDVRGLRSGSYRRIDKQFEGYRIVTLTGSVLSDGNSIPLEPQEWIIFSRPIFGVDNKPAGDVEVAFRLGIDEGRRWVIRADDSTLVVFFPTEKESHCGFLIQGPYKTTPSRDNVPHDNKWNAYLVAETAILVGEALIKLGDMRLASIGLLQSMPLFRAGEMPPQWFLKPVYDVIVRTFKSTPLIPAAGGRMVSADSARIARGKGLIELFGPKQLSLLLGNGSPGRLDWISPEISESRVATSGVVGFLRDVLGVLQIEPEHLSQYLGESFFAQQSTSWMAKFYAFLLDHERLWRRQTPRGALLTNPFIRLQDNRHVVPYRPDGTPNVYLPSDSESEFETVHRLLAKPRKCADFLRKLGLTAPDITTEVLQKVVPQYEPSSIDITEKKHIANLRKIFRALGSESPSRPMLLERLKRLKFLKATKGLTGNVWFCPPGQVYLRTNKLELFFEKNDSAMLIAEPVDLVRRDRVIGLLRELGVEDKPRRILVSTDDDWKKRRSLRDGGGWTRDIYYHEFDIQGLASYLRALRKSEFAEACRRARLLWDFLIEHLAAYPLGDERLFFRGEYSWSYYTSHVREFDSFFLRTLRETAWIPGKDGEHHKPTDILPQEMAPGFARNATLCDELQMKAEAFVNLAKHAGIRVEDIVFLRQNRDAFEAFKRSLKTRVSADSQTVTSAVLESHSTGPAGSPPIHNFDSDGKEGAAAGGQMRANNGGGLGNAQNRSKAPQEAAERGARAKASTDDGGSSQEGTFFTYVYVESKVPTDGADAGEDKDGRAAHRMAISKIGVEAVMRSERSDGRTPVEMPPLNEGYDIKSLGPNGDVERYIEVKTINAEWGSKGVGLSSAQYEAARLHKGKFWLYVVDNADTDKIRIHRIFSPGDMAKAYIFDSGWKGLREPDEAEGEESRGESDKAPDLA